jgi:hypothetical protein
MAFITIDRKIFDHFLWTERRPRTKFEAWLDLIQLVSFDEENQQIINDIVVKWGRGEYPISYSFLANRWLWSINKTRGYVQTLKNENQINTKTTGKITILTLCNYDEYNRKPQARGQAEGRKKDKQEDKQKAGIKEDIQLNNLIYTHIPPTLENIKLRVEERKLTKFTADSFFAHYEANGWMVGNRKMRNWDAALTYWENNNINNNGTNQQGNQRSDKRVNDYWNNQG